MLAPPDDVQMRVPGAGAHVVPRMHPSLFHLEQVREIGVSQLGPEPHHIADIGEPALAQTAGRYGTQLADPGLRWAVPCRSRDQSILRRSR